MGNQMKSVGTIVLFALVALSGAWYLLAKPGPMEAGAEDVPVVMPEERVVASSPPAVEADAPERLDPHDGAMSVGGYAVFGRIVSDLEGDVSGTRIIYSPSVDAIGLGTRDVSPYTEAIADAGGQFRLWLESPPASESFIVALGGSCGIASRSLVADLSSDELDVGVLQLQPSYRVSGRVVADTGMPISLARVTLDRSASGEVPTALERFLIEALTAWSDEQGRFTLACVPMDAPQLVVTRLPYWRARPVVECAPCGACDLGDVVLPEGLVFAGTVVGEEDGAPIAGARIKAIRRSHQGETETDGWHRRTTYSGDDGAFVVRGLESGTHTLSAIADGYVWAHDFSIEAPVHDVEIVLVKATSAELEVLDAITGDRVPAARIEVRSRRGGNSPENDRDQINVAAVEPGLFGVSGIGPPGIEVVIEADGYERLQLDVSGGTASGEDQRRTCYLTPAPTVLGVVQDHAGRPMDDVVVQMAPVNIEGHTRTLLTQTAADGSFRFLESVAGDWIVWVSPRGYEQLGSLPISLDAAGHVTTMLIELHALGGVEGVVLDHVGEPVPFVPVRTVRVEEPAVNRDRSYDYVHARNGSVDESDETDEAGVFAFDDLPVGTYAAWAARDEADGPPQGAARYVVEPGRVSEVEVTLGSVASISGRVSVSGRAAVGAKVVLVDLAEEVGSTKSERLVTDEFGSFEFSRVWPGSYLLGVQPLSASLPVIRKVAVGDGDHRRVDIDFEGVALGGEVRDHETGQLVRGAYVQLTSMNTMPTEEYPVRRHFRGSVQVTDGEGRFAWGAVQPGRYWVTAARDDRYFPHGEVDVEIAEGKPHDDVVVLVARASTLVGNVYLAESGELLASGVVSAHCPRLGGPRGTARIVDGAYEFPRLRAGTYTLTVKRTKGDRESLGTAVVEIGVAHDAVLDVTVEAE